MVPSRAVSRCDVIFKRRMSNEITSVIHEQQGRPRQLHLRRMAFKVLSGSDKGFRVELDHDVVRIGSSDANHVSIHDSTVSRRHAEVVRIQDGILLRDLGSTNGTWVSEVRVREVFLGEDRVFRVGKTEVQFTLRDEVVDIVPAEEPKFEGLVGQSVAMREVFSVLDRVARTELTVLGLSTNEHHGTLPNKWQTTTQVTCSMPCALRYQWLRRSVEET